MASLHIFLLHLANRHELAWRMRPDQPLAERSVVICRPI
jgi:hypothetical protein